MDDQVFDLQFTRILFSKAQRISFGLLNTPVNKTLFLNIIFRPENSKQVKGVLHKLSQALNGERLKLYISENGGDFLSVSFLWESRKIIFTSSPDRYDKRECRNFRSNLVYGDIVKLSFLTGDDGEKASINTIKDTIELNSLDTIYSRYLP